MRRELHVRFCEGGGVRLPSATRLIYSLALGTGLRLAEIVGLNVGDVYAPDGTPRSRVRILHVALLVPPYASYLL